MPSVSLGGSLIRNMLTHLCRLGCFGDEEQRGFTFDTYSSEKHKPAMFPSGDFSGTPEDACGVVTGVCLT